MFFTRIKTYLIEKHPDSTCLVILFLGFALAFSWAWVDAYKDYQRGELVVEADTNKPGTFKIQQVGEPDPNVSLWTLDTDEESGTLWLSFPESKEHLYIYNDSGLSWIHFQLGDETWLKYKVLDDGSLGQYIYEGASR